VPNEAHERSLASTLANDWQTVNLKDAMTIRERTTTMDSAEAEGWRWGQPDADRATAEMPETATVLRLAGQRHGVMSADAAGCAAGGFNEGEA